MAEVMDRVLIRCQSVDLAMNSGEGRLDCASFLFLFAASVAFFGTRCEDRAAVDK